MKRTPATMNRWWIVISAIAIQLCLGASYAWSVFTPKLVDPSGPYAFTTQQAQGVFSLSMITVSVFVIIAGRLLKVIKPRTLSAAGGILLGAGYILGGVTGSTFLAQMVCIGLLGGVGIGLAYVVPIAVGIKWFPDKKGLVTGLTVAGYGVGAVIWVKAAGSWFSLLERLDFFGLGGVQSVFILYGAIYLIVILLGSLFMINPPENWVPEGCHPEADGSAAQAGAVSFESGDMLKTPQFYMVFFTFLFASTAGMMVIGCIKLFGIDVLSSRGLEVAAASSVAGTAMAFYAVFNGLGRILWGTVSDTFGRRATLVLICLLQTVIMALFFRLGGIPAGLIISACIIGFNYGGIYAIFPALTADYFGNLTVGKNYGWVFLASGLSGIVGPQIAGYFKDAALAAGGGLEAWSTSFSIAAAGCLAGAVITLFNRPPRPPRQAL